MGLLGQLGETLQATGLGMQGRTRTSQALFKDVDRQRNLEAFREQVKQMGHDPDDPMTWNEDILALGAKTGVLEPEEVMKLGMSLMQRRQAMAQEQRQEEKFNWQKEDRERQLENLNKLKDILSSTSDPDQAINQMWKVGLISPEKAAQYQQNKKKFMADMQKLAVQRKNLLLDRQIKQKRLQTLGEAEKTKKELREALKGAKTTTERATIYEQFGYADEAAKLYKVAKEKGDLTNPEPQIDSKTFQLFKALGWQTSEYNPNDPAAEPIPLSLPEVLERNAPEASPEEIPIVKQIAKRLKYKIVYANGDTNKPGILLDAKSKKIIPLGWGLDTSR